MAYAGPETGVKDRASYVVRQHKLTFMLTTPLRSNNEIADHVYKHGDGVKSLSLRVQDATKAWENLISHNAFIIQTDYPFQLMQYLIDKKLHHRPKEWINVDLIELPVEIR